MSMARELCNERKHAGDQLVIQLARLGDFCQTVPLLQDLRASRQAEQSQIALVCDCDTANAVGAEVDQVIALPLRQLRQGSVSSESTMAERLLEIDELLKPIREHPWQRVFNLNINPLAGMISELATAEEHYGWRYGESRSAGSTSMLVNSLWSTNSQRGSNNLLLADLYRKQLEDGVTSALPPHRRAEGFVVMHPGAGAVERRLPLQFWASVARMLVADRRVQQVRLTGSLEEKRTCDQIARIAGPGVVSIAGETDLTALREQLQESILLVAVDTGVLHLGALTQTPLLGIYPGAAWWGETAPFQEGALCVTSNRDCYPCKTDNNRCHWECFTDFRAEPVAAIALAQLAGNQEEIVAQSVICRQSGLKVVQQVTVTDWLTGVDTISGRSLLRLPGVVMRSLITGSTLPVEEWSMQTHTLNESRERLPEGLSVGLEECITELHRNATPARIRTLRMFGGLTALSEWTSVIQLLQKEVLSATGNSALIKRVENHLQLLRELDLLFSEQLSEQQIRQSMELV